MGEATFQAFLADFGLLWTMVAVCNSPTFDPPRFWHKIARVGLF